jgi:hypothetical protein
MSFIIDGPAIKTFPAFVIFTIFMHPIDVDISVFSKISYFASNSLNVPVAVAIK